MISPRLTGAIVIVVTTVWVLSFVATIAVPTYRADPEINVIFMGVVGGALALRKRGEGHGDS